MLTIYIICPQISYGHHNLEVLYSKNTRQKQSVLLATCENEEFYQRSLTWDINDGSNGNSWEFILKRRAYE